ncbi:MAG: hypothetical protein JO066_14780 [Verrucomicrobia bacterium]|nr:hypothetical protein [Verrucomicrobiota bacterium]
MRIRLIVTMPVSANVTTIWISSSLGQRGSQSAAPPCNNRVTERRGDFPAHCKHPPARIDGQIGQLRNDFVVGDLLLSRHRIHRISLPPQRIQFRGSIWEPLVRKIAFSIFIFDFYLSGH